MKPLTTEIFIERSRSIFGNKYDYSNTVYKHSLEKVEIVCPKHGSFFIKPSNHINNKQGCELCGRISTKSKIVRPLDSIISSLDKDKLEKYWVNSKISINSNRDVIKVKCSEHGEFETEVRNLIRSKFCGCKKCKLKADKFNNETFFEKSKQIHGHKYIYDNVNYEKAHQEVEIICKKHGSFFIKPYIHLSGGGFCPSCTKFSSSLEEEVRDYLRELGIVFDVRFRKFSKHGIKELDIISHDFKIAIEINGLYWHSEQFKSETYHLDKTKICESLGYRLIHIFEDEWRYKKNICKSMLSHIFNKTCERKYARKGIVRELNSKQANEFLDANHLQGKCNSSYRLGLFLDEELVSVMTFGSLRKSLGSKSSIGSYELIRFCCKNNYSVAGAASKLFNFFLKIKEPSTVVSYSDKSKRSGKLYTSIGFKLAGSSKPNYFYMKLGKRYNRFSFRKDLLQRKYNCPKDKTEKEFMKELGFLRIYDCGADKFIWKK